MDETPLSAKLSFKLEILMYFNISLENTKKKKKNFSSP